MNLNTDEAHRDSNPLNLANITVAVDQNTTLQAPLVPTTDNVLIERPRSNDEHEHEEMLLNRNADTIPSKLMFD